MFPYLSQGDFQNIVIVVGNFYLKREEKLRRGKFKLHYLYQERGLQWKGVTELCTVKKMRPIDNMIMYNKYMQGHFLVHREIFLLGHQGYSCSVQ